MTYDFYKAEGRLFEGEYAAIPEDMREGMTRYVEERKEPGGFLSAVIRNDLLDAVCRADRRNLLLVREYAQWFYNVAPSGCAGSPEKMRAWLGVCTPTHWQPQPTLTDEERTAIGLARSVFEDYKMSRFHSAADEVLERLLERTK